MTPRMAFLTAMGLFTAGGCTCAPQTGSLEVDIHAPSGPIPAVTVTGPSGYSKTLQATTLLSGLTPGTYTVAAPGVRSSDPVVSLEYSATIEGTPATVTANATADAGVSFALVQGTGQLWLAQDQGTAVSFLSSQLADAGTVTLNANTTVLLDGGYVQGVAFDEAGDLWLSNETPAQLVAFTPIEIATGSTGGPLVTIQDYVVDAGIGDAGIAFLDGVEGIAFDRQGGLWVANCGRHFQEVSHYTASQVLAGGSVLPHATLFNLPFDAGMDAGTGSLPCPYDVAIDSAGNLWVANYSSSIGNIVEFKNPGQYSGWSAPMPDAVLLPYVYSGALPDGGPVAPEYTLTPNGLAFDSAGALWVANWSALSVTKFSGPSLIGISRPVPDATLTSHSIGLPDGGQAEMLRTPANLAFDNRGDLWVITNTPGALLRFSNPGSWRGFVSPDPDTAIFDDFLHNENEGQFAFNPSPANLPLAH